MFCGKCGAKLDEGAKFCHVCGTRMEDNPMQPAGQPTEASYPAPEQYPQPAGQPQPAPAQYSPQQPTPPSAAQQPGTQEYPPQSAQQLPQQHAYQAQPAAQPAPTQYQPPSAQYQPPTAQYQPPPFAQPAPGKKKMSKQMRTLLIVLPIVVVLAAGGFLLWYLLSDKADDTSGPDVSVTETSAPSETPALQVSTLPSETPGAATPEVEKDIELPFVTYSYLDKLPEAVIGFTTVDSIFPSNYRMLDSLVVFTGYSDYGELDVLIEVEVPGFTQQYKQKVTLGRQVTKLRIIPPLVTGAIDLNSEKTAQLIYSVTEIDSGKVLVQESKNLKLYSKFDMVWGEPGDWRCYTDNILAWMTPDAPEILELKRDAIDYLAYITNGELNSLIGYQDYNYFDHYYFNTWVQAVAIQGAMSDITGIRYNNSVFSMDAQQRVKLPADTLTSRSGLCIETALVMASALQSTGMHVMLVFPPGHAQVAVEAWPDSAEYFLIETTILPMAQDNDAWNNTVLYLNSDEWLGYITGEGYYTYGPCYILDCELGEKLGIRAMSN